MLVDFLIQNFIVQLIFTFIINIIYDFTDIVENVFSCSLWNILIIYLVKVCNGSDS